LRSLWERFVTWLRGLFAGGREPVRGMPPGHHSWPAYNPDARQQLFEMFPTGRGTVLGFVGVQVWRQNNAIYGQASGFGGASVFVWNGDLYYQQQGKQPNRVAGALSTRDGFGRTHFQLTLDSGKTVEASIEADGRTIRYGKYSITLY
jgi:hypothetical protein